METMTYMEWETVLHEKEKELDIRKLGNCSPEYKEFQKKLVSSRIPKGATVTIGREFDDEGDWPDGEPQYSMTLHFDWCVEGHFWDHSSCGGIEDVDEEGHPLMWFEMGTLSNPDGGPNWMKVEVRTDDIIVTVDL
jgi:hypothetical protein